MFSITRAAGDTYYGRLIHRNGTVWNTVTSQFESSPVWANTDIAMTEVSSGCYVFTPPSGLSFGLYTVAIYKQAGGGPVIGDTLDSEEEITVVQT